METTAMPIRFMRSCRVKRCFYSRPYSPCCHPGHLVSGSQAMSTAPLTANNIPNVVGNRVMESCTSTDCSVHMPRRRHCNDALTWICRRTDLRFIRSTKQKSTYQYMYSRKSGPPIRRIPRDCCWWHGGSGVE